MTLGGKNAMFFACDGSVFSVIEKVIVIYQQ